MPALPPDDNPPPFLTPSNQERFGDAPPAFSQQNVDIAAAMRPHLETLATLTSQMRDNFEGIGKLLDSNAGHLERIGRAQRANVRISADEFSRRKQIRDTDEARAKTLEKINAAERKNNDSLAQQFRSAGMLNRGRIEYQDPSGRIASASIEDYRNNPTLRRQVRGQLASNLIARSADPNNRFSVSEAIQHMAHGNIGAAVGELMQGFGATQGIIGRMGDAGAGLAERGAATGGLAGLGMRGAGALLGRGLPFLASPAGLYVIQRELRQGIRTYQNDLRSGMQTGLTGSAAARDTFSSQIRARVEGLNPFDALTTQMAEEIAKGIQSEGFSGPIRAAWQDSVTDVVKRTGMDAGTALQLMTTSANTLGQTANQFRADMTLVQSTAHDTTISVTAAAQAMQQMQTAFFARGGQPATAQAGVLATTLTRALPRNVALGGRLTGAISQNWQTLVARAGINPALAFEPQILSQATKILDQNAAMLWRIKNSQPLTRNMPLQEWVTWMEGASPNFFETLLPGSQNADIVAFMNRGKNGGFEHAQQNATADIARSRARTVKNHHGFLAGIVNDISSAAQGAAVTVGRGLDYATSGITGRNYHVFRNAANIGHTDDINFGATQRNLIRSFANQLDDLTPAQRARVLAPLRSATSSDQLRTAADSAQTIYIKIHPQAAHYFTTEPAKIQRYYDSRRGASSTQGLVRPAPVGSGGGTYGGSG